MIYAIGDIHGMSDQLRDRLAAIRAHATAAGIDRPRAVFLGDYVDRGPDSKGVLDILTGDAMESFDPVFLLGNHDLVLREVVNGTLPSFDWLVREGGWETLASYGDFRGLTMLHTAKKFRTAVPSAHQRFLEALVPSWRFGDLYFSHAGVNPERALEEQSDGALIYGDPRMFDHDHDILASQLRQRLGARVVHGHWANKRAVQIWSHRIGIDTGAGYGSGRLSAVSIEDEDVEVLP